MISIHSTNMKIVDELLLKTLPEGQDCSGGRRMKAARLRSEMESQCWVPAGSCRSGNCLEESAWLLWVWLGLVKHQNPDFRDEWSGSGAEEEFDVLQHSIASAGTIWFVSIVSISPWPAPVAVQLIELLLAEFRAAPVWVQTFTHTLRFRSPIMQNSHIQLLRGTWIRALGLGNGIYRSIPSSTASQFKCARSKDCTGLRE